MTKERLDYLKRIEELGTEQGWVSPMNQEDIEYFANFRKVCNRYNINPSEATRLEYDFVVQITESEFYGNRVANQNSLTYAQKNHQLFLQQKSLLNLFLTKGAITQEQYDKSLHDLKEKMER